MERVTNTFGRLLRLLRNEREGATAVEYAIMVVSIAAVIVALVFAIGVGTNQTFDDTCTAMDAHMDCGSS